jgi:glycine C-acetyltransferase
MDDLKRCLEQAKEKRRRIICTDGVFSMDGDVARLDKICDLADTYDSMVMVDDSHATGYLGDTGRGSGEYWHVEDRIDLLTTTFGKGLGGASGGCISGKKATDRPVPSKCASLSFLQLARTRHLRRDASGTEDAFG